MQVKEYVNALEAEAQLMITSCQQLQGLGTRISCKLCREIGIVVRNSLKERLTISSLEGTLSREEDLK